MTAAAAPTAELRHVDPTAIAIADNIRQSTAAVADLAEKVQDGVLVPVLAYLADDGTVTVIDGQLRTLAAREAGLATIPAYIIPAADAATADTDRIIAQYVTNEHRTDLLPSERAKAIEQLHLAGLSPTKIARKLRRTKADIDHSLTVVKSADTLDRIDTMPDLTLDQAAAFAEYEHDAEATDDLLEALEEGRFDYMVQYLADTADERAAIAAAGAELDQAGIQWGQHYRGRALREFVHVDNGSPITIDDVPTQNRFARIVTDEETSWIDANGKAVDETLIDWSIEEATDEAAAPAEGMIDPRTLTQHTEVKTEIDWQVTDHGTLDTITPCWEWRRANPNNTPGEQITAEQIAEKEEAERQQRRRVKTLNKQAVSAAEVRIAKITEWLTRKTAPKEHKHAIAGFITETLWQRHDLLSLNRAEGNTQALAKKMIGSDQILQDTAEATADRAQIINLGIALAAHEAAIEKDSWRSGYRRHTIAPYFALLTEVIGHTLTEVEQAMAGDLDPNAIDID